MHKREVSMNAILGVKFRPVVVVVGLIVSINTHAASLAPLIVDKTKLYVAIVKGYAKDAIDINADRSSVVSREQYKYKDKNLQFNLILNIEHNSAPTGELVSLCSVMLVDDSYKYLSRSTLQLPNTASSADVEKTECRNFEAVSLRSGSLPSFIVVVSYGPNQYGSAELHAPEPKKFSTVVIDVVRATDGILTVRQNTSCLAVGNSIRTISAAKLQMRKCGRN
jgi:hypothetical protein